jgi:hypothetical protein
MTHFVFPESEECLMLSLVQVAHIRTLRRVAEALEWLKVGK